MKPAKRGDSDYCWAGDGGCWFCYRKTDGLVFDREFDTFVHSDCIVSVLAEEPDHPEAYLMRYLIEDKIP